MKRAAPLAETHRAALAVWLSSASKRGAVRVELERPGHGVVAELEASPDALDGLLELAQGQADGGGTWCALVCNARNVDGGSVAVYPWRVGATPDDDDSSSSAPRSGDAQVAQLVSVLLDHTRRMGDLVAALPERMNAANLATLDALTRRLDGAEKRAEKLEQDEREAVAKVDEVTALARTTADANDVLRKSLAKARRGSSAERLMLGALGKFLHEKEMLPTPDALLMLLDAEADAADDGAEPEKVDVKVDGKDAN